MVGRSKGRVILKKDWSFPAPSMEALSYSSEGMVVRPVEIRIMLKGMPIHTLATTTAIIAVPGEVSQSIFWPMSPRLLRM